MMGLAKNRLFAITTGDPAEIGPEVTLKAIEALPPEMRERLIVIGDIETITDVQKSLGRMGELKEFDFNRKPKKGVARFYTMRTLPPYSIKPGHVSEKSGFAAAMYIEKAVELFREGVIEGVVTAPIHKKALSLAGYKYAGHTEMLADLTGAKEVAMMLVSSEMRVVVLTTHLSLKKAVAAVKKKAVLEKLELIHRELKPKKPIAVCGLNPHASDGGIFGKEEEKEIIPAVKAALRKGINAEGPLAADTVFAPRIRKKYGVILAMYHDQGLVGIKAVSFGNCANITLGLPFIRTSVDHGTALDIAGKGIADPSSMIYAIRSAFEMAEGQGRA